MALIELHDVSKTYDGQTPVHALSNLSLDIASGEFSALAGPSGSGKTTLLNLIGALDRPSRGFVRVDGRNLADLSSGERAEFRLRRLGFVFQSFNLFPVLSVAENLEYVAALQGVPAAERRERAKDLLLAVGMEELASKRPGQLSGGQQQRVAVLRAIFSEPLIVLADEPTANLDTANAESLLNLMERLNLERRVTFLFSTHDPRVMRRARRLIRLRDGRVESDLPQTGGGSPEPED
jgi:putative ABC transport system ATP-binding protein